VADIKPHAADSVPYGWLCCDGSAINRIKYASLFAAIGVTWGTGNGSTTFNIPDLRGRTVMGANLSNPFGSVQDDTTAKNGLSVSGNAQTISVSGANHSHLYQHKHAVGSSIVIDGDGGGRIWAGDGGHRMHNVSLDTGFVQGYNYATGNWDKGEVTWESGNLSMSGSMTPSVSLGKGDDETRSKNLRMIWIIKY